MTFCFLFPPSHPFPFPSRPFTPCFPPHAAPSEVVYDPFDFEFDEEDFADDAAEGAAPPAYVFVEATPRDVESSQSHSIYSLPEDELQAVMDAFGVRCRRAHARKAPTTTPLARSPSHAPAATDMQQRIHLLLLSASCCAARLWKVRPSIATSLVVLSLRLPRLSLNSRSLSSLLGW